MRAWSWCGDQGRSVGDGCAANIQGDPVDVLSPGCQLSWQQTGGSIAVLIQAATDAGTQQGCQQFNEPARSDCSMLIVSLVRQEVADSAALSRAAMRCPWLYDGPELARLSNAVLVSLQSS